MHSSESPEDLRAWGRQLYGFLGILYLPLFVDALWFGNGSHVKLADVEPETEKNRQIVEPVGKALGKVFKRQTPAVVDALAALRDSLSRRRTGKSSSPWARR